MTAQTDKGCLRVLGGERCRVAIQTTNVEVDDRGLVPLAGRATTGQVTAGPARTIAGVP
jgi:hypothetical protein